MNPVDLRRKPLWSAVQLFLSPWQAASGSV